MKAKDDCELFGQSEAIILSWAGPSYGGVGCLRSFSPSLIHSVGVCWKGVVVGVRVAGRWCISNAFRGRNDTGNSTTD